MTETTYKKVIVQDHGRDPHHALQIVDAPMTDPSPNELLIRNHYAGVNYTDIAIMLGLSLDSAFLPMDFGVESAGQVIAVGEQVNGFVVGDMVMSGLPGNGFREYQRIAANLAFKVPSINPEYLGLFVSGASAKIALEFIGKLQTHETVMITAGLASVGHYAVQIASNADNTVLATCSSDDEADLLRELGADRIFVRGKDDIQAILSNEYKDRLNVVFDAYGGAIFDACLDNMAPQGRIIASEALHAHLGDSGYLHRVDVYNQLINNSVSLMGINFRDYAPQILRESVKMVDLYQRGEIRTLLDPQEFHGIERVPDAIQHLKSGKGQGKLYVKLI